LTGVDTRVERFDATRAAVQFNIAMKVAILAVFPAVS
jgi:hypothetical protein